MSGDGKKWAEGWDELCLFSCPLVRWAAGSLPWYWPLTWLCMNLRLIPSSVTCSSPPSPLFMSWTGNSPPSSGPEGHHTSLTSEQRKRYPTLVIFNVLKGIKNARITYSGVIVLNILVIYFSTSSEHIMCSRAQNEVTTSDPVLLQTCLTVTLRTVTKDI